MRTPAWTSSPGGRSEPVQGDPVAAVAGPAVPAQPQVAGRPLQPPVRHVLPGGEAAEVTADVILLTEAQVLTDDIRRDSVIWLARQCTEIPYEALAVMLARWSHKSLSPERRAGLFKVPAVCGSCQRPCWRGCRGVEFFDDGDLPSRGSRRRCIRDQDRTDERCWMPHWRSMQAQMPPVAKNKTGKIPGKDGKQGYSYDYADLADVTAALLPLMGSRTGVHVQAHRQLRPRASPAATNSSTVIGREGRGRVPAALARAGEPAATRLVHTYARRYSLCS